MKTSNRALIRRRWCACVYLMFICTLIGCAQVVTREADYITPEFDGYQVDELVVLPLLDHRIDPSDDVDLDTLVIPIIKRSLDDRGYRYALLEDPALVSHITRAALESPTPEFIASLQPASARWVLVLVLDDFRSMITFGAAANAEMSGYLFDRQRQQLVWREKEIGRSGQGGLAGLLIMNLQEKMAVELAALHVLQSLPVRGD